MSVCAVLALAVAAAAPAPALADGDPASDVLASQPLFLPADGGIPQAQATQLRGLVLAAERAGVPMRVAVIATQADLGSVTELWRRPQSYARFLGQELALPLPPAAQRSGSALGSVDLGSWLALIAGAVLIVLAWTASLRARGPGARPPGLRRAR